jgi:hypothetical protein
MGLEVSTRGEIVGDGAGWRDDDRVGEVLRQADLLYVAVATRHGPHVHKQGVLLAGRGRARLDGDTAQVIHRPGAGHLVGGAPERDGGDLVPRILVPLWARRVGYPGADARSSSPCRGQ